MEAVDNPEETIPGVSFFSLSLDDSLSYKPVRVQLFECIDKDHFFVISSFFRGNALTIPCFRVSSL